MVLIKIVVIQVFCDDLKIVIDNLNSDEGLLNKLVVSVGFVDVVGVDVGHCVGLVVVWASKRETTVKKAKTKTVINY